jgi:hypothetical protein
VQLSGIAAVEWGTPGAPGDDGGVGRRVRFTAHHTVSEHTLAAHAQAGVIPYQHNPSIPSTNVDAYPCVIVRRSKRLIGWCNATLRFRG